MRTDLIQVLAPTYSHTEVSKAQQRLADTKSELARWDDDVKRMQDRRSQLAALSNSTELPQSVRLMLVQEYDLQYNSLSAAEAKAATCRRRIEEIESFLRRAEQAHEVLGWK